MVKIPYVGSFEIEAMEREAAEARAEGVAWLNGAPRAPQAPIAPSPITDAYSAVDGLNWSTLRHLATSAKLLRWRVDHPREDTDALELGRAIHCATLEPDRWPRAYVARPSFGDGRTKDAKAAKAAWMATIPAGCEVLDAETHELAERCAFAINAHPAASRLLRAGRAEEIVQWTDHELGVKCKARLDYITPAHMLDLKSTRRTTIRDMTRDVATLLYHGQLAWYFDGAVAARVLPPDAEVYAVAAQTVEPFDVVVFRVGVEALGVGRRLCRSLLEMYVACESSGWWPGLAPEVIPLQLPTWAAGGNGEETEI